jgi:hypothetical protein
MSAFSKCVRFLAVLGWCSALVVGVTGVPHSARSRLGPLQHDINLLQHDLAQSTTHMTHSIIHDEDVLLPSHLIDTSDPHPTIAPRRSLRSSQPFTQQPWPYTHSDPPCTTYARQDNCVGDPPLAPGPLPACGAFSGVTPNTTVFAILGDYGLDGNCESTVHGLVMKLQAQFGPFSFIMTTGDNAYWGGSCESLQSSVLQYYGSFLPNASLPCTDPMREAKRGYVNPHYVDTKHFREDEEKLSHELHRYSQPQRPHTHYSDLYADEPLLPTPGHHVNTALPRFFPSMGNHDWSTYRTDPLHMPYFQVFDYLMDFPPADLAHGQFYKMSPIPGLEIYSLNSNLGAPDATPLEQDLFVEQVNWLKASLTNSTASFKFVHFHHPPFCTAQHDPLAPWMDLDYEDWGASGVFVGHEHVYERLLLNRPRGDGSAPTMPYIVNGLGGHPWTYSIDGCPAYPGSQFRYNKFHGAQLVIQSWNDATQSAKLDVCFYSLENGGSMVDQFEIEPSGLV